MIVIAWFYCICIIIIYIKYFEIIFKSSRIDCIYVTNSNILLCYNVLGVLSWGWYGIWFNNVILLMILLYVSIPGILDVWMYYHYMNSL